MLRELQQLLRKQNASLYLDFIRYEGNVPGERIEVDLMGDEKSGTVQLLHSEWKWDWYVEKIAEGVFSCRLVAQVQKGANPNGSVDLRLVQREWSTLNYVFAPAALYNGNRYRAVSSRRREHLPDPGPDMPITITQIPRLNWQEGESEVQLLSGDCSTPGIGFSDVPHGYGLLWLTPQGTRWGNTGLTIRESEDRQQATFILRAPGVREVKRYQGRPSLDRGALFLPGDHVELCCLLVLFPVKQVIDIFDHFWIWRNYFRGKIEWRHEIPFSATWKIQEEKYNRQNWVEEYGYYSVGMRESPPQDWQTGWVGGPNAAYALLCEGDEKTRQRALRIFDFLYRYGAVAPNGFLRSCFHKGKWQEEKGVFMRYQGDSLFFLTKMLWLMKERDPQFRASPEWEKLLRGIADAFIRVWRKHRVIPQFVCIDNDEIWLNGTAAGSLAPGGLMLAAKYFQEDSYQRYAEAIGEYFYQQHVAKGILNGGPGDILQAVDSESAAAMLESYVTLYEFTQDRKWITYAEDTAKQCASWVVSYDYQFPPDSTFGRMRMLTTGTVFANVQNKHSAPGICTLSGCAFLKLFRVVGDYGYLQLIQEIAHAIGQYMSREDRPICDRRANKPWPVMDPGWINERVNMSDWEVRGEPHEEIGVGEIFGGSTWSEAAMLLTRAELPGIYVRPDSGLLCVLDHVDARILQATSTEVTLLIHNPTSFPASVKVLCETSEDLCNPLGPTPCAYLPEVFVPARGQVTYTCCSYWHTLTQQIRGRSSPSGR